MYIENQILLIHPHLNRPQHIQMLIQYPIVVTGLIILFIASFVNRKVFEVLKQISNIPDIYLHKDSWKPKMDFCVLTNATNQGISRIY